MVWQRQWRFAKKAVWIDAARLETQGKPAGATGSLVLTYRPAAARQRRRQETPN